MTVYLTPEQAHNKLNEIEQGRQQAVKALNNIQDLQTDMLSSAWQGDSAAHYGKMSETQHGDITQIITQLNAIVETATHHIGGIQNADQHH